ncbi:hypothetical protein FNK08_07430 [Francisella tularensis]|nr:hypothetical protein [Francisella tularensis]MXC12706.1 hypothetical protein [Francisella tularensis]OCQ68421.1 hypothetical protein ASZ94_02075 [Francisella tularensis]
MIASLLVSSCTIHPLGIPDETWQKMTPQQQADAYQKQADIDAKQRAQELAYIVNPKDICRNVIMSNKNAII